MGIEDSTSSNRNRWKTARERNRLKARFDIQSRIARHVTSHGADEAATALAGEEMDKEKNWSIDDMKLIRKYLHAVIKNVNATFSLAALSRDAELLNYPLPFLAELETGDPVSESNSGNNTSKETDKKEDKKTIISEISMLLSPKISWNHHPYQKLQQQTEKETIVSVEQALPRRPQPHEQPQPATLATSKYGPLFVAHRLIPYMQSLQKSQQRQLTLMEYSSLLGRHGIVGSLLLGGLDPTISSGDGRGGRSQLASQQVLRLFHSIHHQSRGPNENIANTHVPIIPLSIWCYVIRSVIEMRMNGVLAAKYGKSDYNLDEKCQVCQNDKESDSSISMLLRFGAPCGHSFCEPCIWMHLVQHAPQCCVDVKANVVTCPVCNVEFEGFQHADGDCNFKKQIDAFDNKSGITNLSIQNIQPIQHEIKDEVFASNISTDCKKMIEQKLQQRREQRRLESLAKFSKLPATTADLKQLSEKVNTKFRPKKEKDPLHRTWESALRPLVQGHQSQDVRIERFFKAVTSSPPMVIAYLDAGFDVNMQNIYGQTPLYIACWKGSAMVVRWLLEYGADANIRANGGSSCWSVAKKYCRRDVLGLLKRYCSDVDEFGERNSYQSTPMVAPGRKNICQVTMLIEPSVDHPGAGACIVDNALSHDQLQRLDELWRSLPISDSCAVDENMTKQQSDATLNPMVVSEKAFDRPSRSYFCDAEQEIQDMMEECVAAARNAVESRHQKVESNDEDNVAPTSIFQHIRFLHYDHVGGVLPAHVDLCRVDETSGCRSSHTFIFYLSDCKQGGETALLKNLSNPEVLAVAQPKKGRALIFPHLCPHAGQEVLDVPKVLLRGEVAFNL